MNLRETIKESTKNMSEASRALITAAGYDIADTMDEWKAELEEHREEREKNARKEAERRRARAKECCRMLTESGVDDVGLAYREKEKEYTRLQEEYEELERTAAEDVPEIMKKRKNKKIINVMAGTVLLIAGVGFFAESLALVLFGIIGFVAGLIYDLAVTNKIEHTADAAMPEHLRKKKAQLDGVKTERDALKSLYEVQQEYEELNRLLEREGAKENES